MDPGGAVMATQGFRAPRPHRRLSPQPETARRGTPRGLGRPGPRLGLAIDIQRRRDLVCARPNARRQGVPALVSGDGPPLASKRLAPGRAWRWVRFRVVATRSRRSARRRPNARQGFRNRAWPIAWSSGSEHVGRNGHGATLTKSRGRGAPKKSSLSLGAGHCPRRCGRTGRNWWPRSIGELPAAARGYTA